MGFRFLGFLVYGFGLRITGLGFWVLGVLDLGFRVLGFGFIGIGKGSGVSVSYDEELYGIVLTISKPSSEHLESNLRGCG